MQPAQPKHRHTGAPHLLRVWFAGNHFLPSRQVETKKARDTGVEVGKGGLKSGSLLPFLFCDVHGESPSETALPPEFMR